MKNSTKTTILTVLASIIGTTIAYSVQLKGQNSVESTCSYLDPITIDILAFLAAGFLAIEGAIRIWLNKDAPVKTQISRMVRVGFGFAIMTLHIMQFMHK